MKVSYLFLGLFMAAGCAHTPAPICQDGAARQAGYFQAMEGRLADESVIKGCSEKETLLDHFRTGYQEGLRKHCDSSEVERVAMHDGETGAPLKFLLEKYAVCENKEKLKSTYEAYHQKGQKTYCGQDRLQSLGEGRGLSGLASEFPKESLAVCGVDRSVDLQDSYYRGYHDGLGRFCSASSIHDEAYTEGSKGNPKQDLTKKYALCSNDQRREIDRVYDSYYAEGLAKWCSPESVTQEAKRRAQSGANPEFPVKLQACLHTYPDAKITFPKTFAAERKRFVESHCTYQAGLSDGVTDASKSTLKKRKAPEACDTSEDDNYYEGYSLGWRQEKDRLCDVGLAYERGMEDARHKRKKEYSMPTLCPHDYQEKLYTSYQQGYTFITNQSSR